MTAQSKTMLTAEEYLEAERTAEYKSEYYRGEIFAMAGAGNNHNIITANVIGMLYGKCRVRGCTVYPSDMRLHIPETGLYTYPDVMVVCGRKEFTDEKKDTVTNPVLIVEVLSGSTESYDRGRKFGFYRSIPSLREYLLLDSQRVMAEKYLKNDAGLWELHESPGLSGAVQLASVGVDLPLQEVYEGTEDLQEN
jgi:Uma2 family endonuclease